MSDYEQASTCRVALKEWAAVCRAIESGDQLIVLRKGGISEERKEFRVEHPDFFLFPTYEHQRPELVKPGAARYLDPDANVDGPRSSLELRLWCRAAAIYEVTDPTRLEALSDFHIWVDSLVLDRLRWRPTRPLSVVALRAYRLPEPVLLPMLPAYGGCRSWITFEEPLPVAGAQPVMDESAFTQRLERLASALGQPELEMAAL